jgi:hypothetical protein
MTQRIQLSKRDIQEFQFLYFKAYGIALSDEKAEKEAIRLLEFMSFMLYER